MSNYILYLAAGNTDNINECRYSLLKYLALYNLKPPSNITIVVNTDSPAIFESFDPFFEKFELEEIREPFPEKMRLVNKTLESKQGNLLYMDVDSYFMTPVDSHFESLQGGNLLFYKKKPVDQNNEAQIQKIKELFSNNSIIVEDEQIPYLQYKDFYSTELIGVNSRSLPYLKKVSGLYSKLATHLPGLISEEFACTYFTSDAPVQTVEKKVTSYRNFPQFKNLLRLFFEKNQEESIPNLVKLVHHIDANTILAEKKRFDRQPFVKKLLSALTGKAWSVHKYQNKF